MGRTAFDGGGIGPSPSSYRSAGCQFPHQGFIGIGRWSISPRFVIGFWLSGPKPGFSSSAARKSGSVPAG